MYFCKALFVNALEFYCAVWYSFKAISRFYTFAVSFKARCGSYQRYVKHLKNSSILSSIYLNVIDIFADKMSFYKALFVSALEFYCAVWYSFKAISRFYTFAVSFKARCGFYQRYVKHLKNSKILFFNLLECQGHFCRQNVFPRSAIS